MRLWLTLALFGLVASRAALAQPAPALAPDLSVQQAPPSRVGAVTYVTGSLAFHAPNDTAWSAAGLNYPFAMGGSFRSDPQARAQIQIGPTTLSMDGGTEIDVTNLNEEVAQLSLPQGRIHVRLRQLDSGQSFEIDLPQGAVWLLQPGSYDIDAGNPNQGARIAVFAGGLRFGGGGADVAVKSGDAIVVSRTNPVAITSERVPSDAFVEWYSARDYRADRLAAPHYISPHMTGYADLAGYGDWRANPGYGEVWYPKDVSADWAPYRDGHWIWVEPWGWTWVDQQPWGFAPFHYGRWAYIDDRWGWVPGAYVAHPVYAPALVAFVGLGAAGIGVAPDIGPAVGWFPLAPGEVYWPSYTRNTTYIRNINITNVKNINTVIVESHGGAPPQVVNAHFANRSAATVVSQRVFASAEPVAPAVVHVAPAALQKAPVVTHPPQLTPVVAKAPVIGAPPPPAGTAALGSAHRAATATAPLAPGQLPYPGAPGATHPGTRATAPVNTAALPPHPGVAPEHPGAPAGTPAKTAVLPPHPSAAVPTRRTPSGPPPIVHGQTSAPTNTAALPAPSAVSGPHLPPPAASPPVHTRPSTPGTAHAPSAETARRELPTPTGPERRPPSSAVIPSAPPPHPEALAAHPPVAAQVVHRTAVQPSPPPAHPAAAAVVVPRPDAPAVHPFAAPPHPVQPTAQAHVQPAAVAHPGPAHPAGKPAPKERGKEENPHQ